MKDLIFKYLDQHYNIIKQLDVISELQIVEFKTIRKTFNDGNHSDFYYLLIDLITVFNLKPIEVKEVLTKWCEIIDKDFDFNLWWYFNYDENFQMKA